MFLVLVRFSLWPAVYLLKLEESRSVFFSKNTLSTLACLCSSLSLLLLNSKQGSCEYQFPKIFSLNQLGNRTWISREKILTRRRYDHLTIFHYATFFFSPMFIAIEDQWHNFERGADRAQCLPSSCQGPISRKGAALLKRKISRFGGCVAVLNKGRNWYWRNWMGGGRKSTRPWQCSWVPCLDEWSTGLQQDLNQNFLALHKFSFLTEHDYAWETNFRLKLVGPVFRALIGKINKCAVHKRSP